ncbi:hypothetical protein BSKO_08070 [Bryopsis sp. KO-2023]|nr:hypothetical protein BSKO_08070 [Bryopsis sp. KO-2023]
MEGVRAWTFIVLAVLLCFQGFGFACAETGGDALAGERISLAIIKEHGCTVNGGVRKLLQADILDADSQGPGSVLGTGDSEGQAEEFAVAASSGQNDVILQLLESGVDPDLTTSVGTPPLWRAAFNDALETVEILLDAGASIDATNANGTTSLYAAAQNGNLDVVQILIDRGADVNKASIWGSSPLVVASQEGFVKIGKALLDAGADPDIVKKNSGQGALWSASFGGFGEVVELLLKHGADVDLADSSKTTPLYAAAQNNRTGVVKSLLGADADPDLARRDGNAPLHTASAHCSVPIVKLLVEAGANRTVQNKDEARPVQVACLEANSQQGFQQPVEDILAPLIKAARRGDAARCKRLISEGELVNEKLWDGWTALHAGSLAGADIVALLLEAGADVNAQESLNRTAVHIGAIQGDLDVVTALVEGGADINLRDNSGKTPLLVAAKEGHEDLVAYMMENGASVTAVDKDRRTTMHLAVLGNNPSSNVLLALKSKKLRVNAKDRFGKTALHYAAEMGSMGIVAQLGSLKADMSVRDSLGRTALHLAAMAGNAEVVEKLLDLGADQSIVDNKGKQPADLVGEGGVPTTEEGKTIVELLLADSARRMIQAAWRGDRDEVVKYLSMGIDVNAAVENGTTVLHVATQRGDAELLKVLLDAGASLELSDNEGRTPLHVAAEYGKSDVLPMFAGLEYNLELKDWHGHHALHVAAGSKSSDVETLEALVKLGAQVNAKDDNGMTPLHTAVKNDRLDLTRVLVGMGADKAMTDNEGREPMDMVDESVRGKRRKQFVSLLKSQVDTTGTEKDTLDDVLLVEPRGGDTPEVDQIHGRTANRKLSKSTTVFVVVMPVVFFSILVVLVAMSVKRFKKQGGRVGRRSWSFKSRHVETPSTILTELYIPSENSMRCSLSGLRSPRNPCFKNPYYNERGTRSGDDSNSTEVEREDQEQESDIQARALAPDACQKWLIANAAARTATEEEGEEEIPHQMARAPARRAASFPEKDIQKHLDKSTIFKSKSERMGGIPKMVPQPIHNRRIDVRRMTSDGRGHPLVSFDVTSQFSSQSFQSMQMNSMYFTASSNGIMGRQLSRESLGLPDELWFTGVEDLQEGIPEEPDGRLSSDMDANISTDRITDGAFSAPPHGVSRTHDCDEKLQSERERTSMDSGYGESSPEDGGGVDKEIQKHS